MIFKIIECKEHKVIDAKLEELNYHKVDLTSVQICDEINVSDNKAEGIHIDKQFSENWKNCLYHCNDIINAETIKIIESMLNNIRYNIISVYKTEGRTLVGCGYCN